jgi:hypothetical protein
MSKKIVLTFNGGFPWFDDYFDYLQTAASEGINALARGGGVGPYIIYGCTYTRTLVTGTTYAYALVGGWIFYNGQPVRVPGNTVNVDESIDEAYISLVTTSAPTAMAFYDGSTPNVINDTTGVVSAQPIGTADTGVLFALAELSVSMSTTVGGSSSISISSVRRQSCQVQFEVVPAPSGVTTLFTVTFGAALDHIPNVFMQALNDDTLAISAVSGGPKLTGVTQNGFSVEATGSVLTSGLTYEWNFFWD